MSISGVENNAAVKKEREREKKGDGKNSWWLYYMALSFPLRAGRLFRFCFSSYTTTTGSVNRRTQTIFVLFPLIYFNQSREKKVGWWEAGRQNLSSMVNRRKKKLHNTFDKRTGEEELFIVVLKLPCALLLSAVSAHSKNPRPVFSWLPATIFVA